MKGETIFNFEGLASLGEDFQVTRIVDEKKIYEFSFICPFIHSRDDTRACRLLALCSEPSCGEGGEKWSVRGRTAGNWGALMFTRMWAGICTGRMLHRHGDTLLSISQNSGIFFPF